MVHALNTEKPILDIKLVKYPTYRASLIGGTLMRLGIGATPFLMPLLLQVGLGWSPLRAGSVTIATAFGAFISKPIVPGIIRKSGFRTTLITANLFGGVLTAAPAIFRGNDAGGGDHGSSLALSGFVRSTQFTAINTVAYADVPPKSVSHASTLATVAQQVGLSLGISFGGLALHLARGRGRRSDPVRLRHPVRRCGSGDHAGLAGLYPPASRRRRGDRRAGDEEGGGVGGRRPQTSVTPALVAGAAPDQMTSDPCVDVHWDMQAW